MNAVFNSLLNVMWEVKLFSRIFLFFDSIIYGIAGSAYNLFNTVVGLNAYNSESGAAIVSAIPQIVSRLKTLFIVFMLFRLAFTLLTYLADPDKFSEAKTGPSKIVVNIAVSIAMLIASPYAFDLINRFQDATLGSSETLGNNFIANLVLGDNGHIIVGDNAGRKFVNKVFLLFCNIKGNYNIGESTKYKPVTFESWGSVFDAKSVTDAFNAVYSGASLFTISPFLWSSRVYYWPIISGIAGIFLVYFFFSFAIDVIIRLFKLKILEVISPIPILMYMDNDGQKYFKNFVKLYVSTFLSFYAKLAAVFLAIVLAQGVTSSTEITESGIWLKVVIIYGIFYFTKELPKVFSDLFGINLGDGKMKGSKFLSALAGAGVGAAVGGFLGATSGAGFGGSLISAATGAARGGFSGGTAQNVGGFVKGQVAAGKGNAKQIATAKAVGGYGAMAMHGIDSVTGANKRSERDVAAMKNLESKRSAMQSTTEAEFGKLENSSGGKWGTKDEYINNDASVQKASAALQEYYKYAANPGGVSNPTVENQLRHNLAEAQDNAKTTWNNGYNAFVNEQAKDASDRSRDVSTLSASARSIREYNETVDSGDVQDALERNVNRADEGSRASVRSATNVQKVEYVSPTSEFGPITVTDHASTISDKDHTIANATAGVNASRQAQYKSQSGGNGN